MIASAMVWLAAVAPAGDEAKSDEIDWLLAAPWASLALVILLAVIVLFAGNILSKGKKRRSAANARPNFDLDVARMESLPAADPSKARDGPVHFEGTVVSSVGLLGGAPERATVYQNRAGASRNAAVASELVVVQCEGGRVAIENLEQARVLAPKEDMGPHKVIRLNLGDKVQLLGHFTREVSGDDDDATQRVYGSLGQSGQAQVRVLHRDD